MPLLCGFNCSRQMVNSDIMVNGVSAQNTARQHCCLQTWVQSTWSPRLSLVIVLLAIEADDNFCRRVQVTGELSNDMGPMRRFMQTFILARQSPKMFYVHNDIFRYQDEVFHDLVDGSCTDVAENHASPGMYRHLKQIVLAASSECSACRVPSHLCGDSDSGRWFPFLVLFC